MTDIEHFNSEVKGYMKIEQYDENDVLVETYEDCNLVMNDARTSMQYLQGGITGMQVPINALRLGTQGAKVVGGVVQPGTPKNPGTDQVNQEYHPEMNSLFQQETGNLGYVYEMRFNSTGPSGQQNIIDSTVEVMWYNNDEMTQPDYPLIEGESKLTREINDRVITFQIDIPKDQANPPQSSLLNTIPYSEAALYCGHGNSGKIFSMKTFPTIYKDDTRRLVVTWSIIF